MSSHVLKFIKLPGADRRILLEVLFALCSVRLTLGVIKFATLQRILDRLKTGKAARAPLASPRRRLEECQRIRWAITAASRRVPGATCLVQALVAEVCLRRRNLPATIHYGVQRDKPGRLLAHAWVTSDEIVVVGDGGMDSYTALTTRESRHAAATDPSLLSGALRPRDAEGKPDGQLMAARTSIRVSAWNETKRVQ